MTFARFLIITFFTEHLRWLFLVEVELSSPVTLMLSVVNYNFPVHSVTRGTSSFVKYEKEIIANSYAFHNSQK